MEAGLKTQAAFAVGMLRSVALASSPFDYLVDALRTVQEADFAMASQPRESLDQLPDTSEERFTSVHSIALACREVAELELSVEAAIMIITRWMEPKQTGLQGLPAAAWRVRANELTGAVDRARRSLELAAASCHHASAVLDVVSIGWDTIPRPVRDAWRRDGRRALMSTRDHLNAARDSLRKMCAAAVQTRDAAKLLIELL